MNELQRRIINELQEGLPVTSRPYEALARKLNVEVPQLLDALKGLKEDGYLRRFGGIVDINKLGVVSTLVGLSVEPDCVESVALYLNKLEGVTHNYERADAYNLWFTLMAQDQDHIDEQLKQVALLSGVDDLINLPAIKKYKTKVIFKL